MAVLWKFYAKSDGSFMAFSWLEFYGNFMLAHKSRILYGVSRVRLCGDASDLLGGGPLPLRNKVILSCLLSSRFFFALKRAVVFCASASAPASIMVFYVALASLSHSARCAPYKKAIKRTTNIVT